MIFDAIIIGAGPAGSTTGLLLAKAGWSIAIVEKKIFPRRKVCGEFMSASNLPILEKLGIADFYLKHGGPEVKRVGLFTGDRMLTSAMPSVDYAINHWGRALGREHLDTALIDMASQAGATLWQPWLINTLQRNEKGFIATISSKNRIKQISARLIMMANGSWEKNLASFKNHEHKSSDLLAFKAHFTKSDLAHDLMPLLAFPGGYGGLVNSDNGRVTLSCCIRRDKLLNIRQQHTGLQAGESVLKHIKASCLGVRQTLGCAIREGSWLSAGPIRPGIRNCYADNVFYVGNSAGEAHPAIAEGISMAMQSGWILSNVMLKHENEIFNQGNCADAGLDYTQQWNSHFANRIRVAAGIAQLAMRPWSVAMISPILKQFPNLLTLGAKLSGKTEMI